LQTFKPTRYPRAGLAVAQQQGTTVQYDAGAVQGQVTRAEHGVIVVTFREDATTQARADQALHALCTAREAA
jgi:hypothetical protein